MDEKMEFELENYKGILVREAQNKERQDAREDQEIAALYRDMDARVATEPKGYQLLFRSLAAAAARGNDLPEAPSWLDEDQQALYVSACRQYGVERFVYASRYSRALAEAWHYLQLGCALEGMVEINRMAPAVGRVKPGLVLRVLPENNKQ